MSRLTKKVSDLILTGEDVPEQYIDHLINKREKLRLELHSIDTCLDRILEQEIVIKTKKKKGPCT